jgi:hypothetical protein
VKAGQMDREHGIGNGMEATVEPLQNPNETTLNDALPMAEPKLADNKPGLSGKYWLFNSDKAKAAQRKSLESKRRQSERAQTAMEMVNQLKAAAIVEPAETYRLNRLARIRAQLALVDSAIETAIKERKPDQNRLKGLVEAQARLADQEQKLSGRPNPGSYRPKAPSTKQSTTGFAPIEE